MVLAIATQKGGAGKTTTASLLSTGLMQKGYSVLLVDLDQQGSLSFIMGADSSQGTTKELLAGEMEAAQLVQHLPMGDIIPADKRLVLIEPSLQQTGGEYKLLEALEPILKEYDFIILDCPPALGRITINALTAADRVLIPAQADVLNLKGIADLYETYKTVRKYTNTKLEIAGVLMTRYNSRAVLRRDIEEVFRSETAPQMQTKVYTSTIREAVAINEAQYSQESLYTWAGKSKAAQDVAAFTDEFIEDLKQGGGI